MSRPWGPQGMIPVHPYPIFRSSWHGRIESCGTSSLPGANGPTAATSLGRETQKGAMSGSEVSDLETFDDDYIMMINDD